MKLWRKYAALAAALVLCLTLAACGGEDGGNGDGGSDDNFYNVPESFEGLVKDSSRWPTSMSTAARGAARTAAR